MKLSENIKELFGKLDTSEQGKLLKELTTLNKDRIRTEVNLKNKKSSIATDNAGNAYKIVEVSYQLRKAENRNAENKLKGEVFPQEKDEDKWTKLQTGAWCYYDNDPANCETYGNLDNWYTVDDIRGLASEGMHKPSDKDWKKNTDNFIGE